MKKVITLILVLVTTLSLLIVTGCQQNDSLTAEDVLKIINENNKNSDKSEDKIEDKIEDKGEDKGDDNIEYNGTIDDKKAESKQPQDPKGAVIQDIQSYSGNTCNHHLEEIKTTFTKQGYFSSNNPKFINEYINLISSNTDFELRRFFDDEELHGEGSGSGKWAFDYVGSENVSSFDSPFNYIKDCNDIELFVLAWGAGDSIQWDIYYADGISYEDLGYRTNQKMSQMSPDTSSAPLPDTPNPILDEKECKWCNGEGSVKCTTCNGKGYYISSGNVPDYSGNDSGGNFSERITCNAVRCVNGRKECLYCNGTGKTL